MNTSRSQIFTPYFERFGWGLSLATAFFVPMKLSWTYAAIIPLILLWLGSILEQRSNPFGQTPKTFLVFFAFVVSVALTALFGVDPWRSYDSLASEAFFALSMLAIYAGSRSRNPVFLLFAMGLGQALAGLHTVVDAISTESLRPTFNGKVTEAGQLAITIPIVVGLLLHEYIRRESDKDSVNVEPIRSYILCGLLGGLGLILIAFSVQLGMSSLHLGILAVFVLAWIANESRVLLRAFALSHGSTEWILRSVVCFVLPLMAAALIINLKRGPWAGAGVAIVLLLAIHRPRLLIPLVLLGLGAIFVFEPVRSRLLQSYSHFFISGGRHDIWMIGFELLSRYPLGVGYENSSILQDFWPEIPDELKHFHNNPLNIAVETGVMNLLLFLFWVLLLLKVSFFGRLPGLSRIVLHGVGAGLIAWQIAGLVEYNFGDGEVRLTIYVVVGALAALARYFKPPNAADSASY